MATMITSNSVRSCSSRTIIGRIVISNTRSSSSCAAITASTESSSSSSSSSSIHNAGSGSYHEGIHPSGIIFTTTSRSSPLTTKPHRRTFHSLSYRNSQPSSSLFTTTSSPIVSTIKSSTHVQIRSFSSGSKRDFYETLGVLKGADKGQVKKAYFKLAKQYHPDTNQGDQKAAEKFKEVTEAYEVLSDDKQRELYDTYGHAGVDPNSGFGQGGPGGNPFGQGGFDFGDGSFHFSSSGPGGQGQIDPEELFDAFFGGGRRQPRGPRRGADLQMHIQVPFHDAVFGTKKDLDLRYQVQDAKTGRVEVKERSVEVDIPAGIDTGMNLRLNGQGAEGDPGAPKGNLLVTVIVEEDAYFQRDGADVHVEVPVSVTQAILGGSVDVKTLTGEVEMKIPKGCQPDSKLVIRGKGIPYLRGRGQKGNQIVHLKVQIPKKINERQEELLREFDEESGKCGGISGRLAEAAGSAFENLFGSKDKSSKSKKNKEDEEDEDEKKQQAQ